jgi:C4-dicarboxylate transporter, DctQ subunit
MPGLRKAAQAFDGVLRGLAAALLAAVTVLVAASAVGRYFFQTPGRLIEELSGLLMIALLFTALAVPGRDGHIRAGIVADRVKGWARIALRVVALVILLLFAGIFVWEAAQQTQFNFRRNIRTELGGIAIWPWSLIMAAALAILAARTVIAFVQSMAAPAQPRNDGA